jgi:hypothetical protein
LILLKRRNLASLSYDFGANDGPIFSKRMGDHSIVGSVNNVGLLPHSFAGGEEVVAPNASCTGAMIKSGMTSGEVTLDNYAAIPRKMAPGTNLTVPACPKCEADRMSSQIFSRRMDRLYNPQLGGA